MNQTFSISKKKLTNKQPNIPYKQKKHLTKPITSNNQPNIFYKQNKLTDNQTNIFYK